LFKIIYNLKQYIFIISILVFGVIYSYSQRSKAIAPENKLVNYVTDKSGTLSPEQISSLASKLSNFEKETSNQVVVYIINSLEGESLEEKSYEIAEQNGIGQKGKNNGVLLFISMADHKLRIEVGYGLEGALPDALSDQIIRKEITPFFKQSRYYEGINAGVDAIMKATKGEYTADKNDKKESGQEFNIGVCGLPIFIFVFFLFFGFFFIFSIVRRFAGGSRYSGHSGWWNSGGWTGGSGSSWSGGSSFSGFSGGGGSFGGGGASGSW
jgi:uncharacterized protein